MKRTLYLILTALTILICSCSCSKEKAAFKAALKSNDLSMVRTYFDTYESDNLNPKHFDRMMEHYNNLIQDSTLYAQFTTDDFVDKYCASLKYQDNLVNGPHSTEILNFFNDSNNAKRYNDAESSRYAQLDSMKVGIRQYYAYEEYIEDFPTGKHVTDAREFLKKNKDAHEKMLGQIKTLSTYFERYIYYDEKNSKYGFTLSTPDKYGEGTIYMFGYANVDKDWGGKNGLPYRILDYPGNTFVANGVTFEVYTDFISEKWRSGKRYHFNAYLKDTSF